MIWCLLAVPALAMVLVFVANVGNVWLARAELQSALDAAALAGAEEWAVGSEATARTAAVSYGAANFVGLQAVPLNLNAGGGTNGNAAGATGEIILGVTLINGAGYDFDANQTPDCVATRARAVLVQKTLTVPSLFSQLLGSVFGPYTISGRAIAHIRCADNEPQLVEVINITFP